MADQPHISVEDFINRKFANSDEFDNSFKTFQRSNKCSFRTKNSETSSKANEKNKHKINEELFKYSRKEFICVHFGEPKGRGKGVKSKTK